MREINLHLLVCSPSACFNHDWARSQELHLDFPYVWQELRFRACCFLRHISRQPDRKRSSWDTSQCSYRMLLSQAVYPAVAKQWPNSQPSMVFRPFTYNETCWVFIIFLFVFCLSHVLLAFPSFFALFQIIASI